MERAGWFWGGKCARSNLEASCTRTCGEFSGRRVACGATGRSNGQESAGMPGAARCAEGDAGRVGEVRSAGGKV